VPKFVTSACPRRAGGEHGAECCKMAFRSMTFVWMTCLRLKVSNWRVSVAARRAAWKSVSKGPRQLAYPRSGQQAVRIP